MAGIAPKAMNDTGERMVPESSDPSTFWEHIYRYRFACRFVEDKTVLDVACGEGYGAASMLHAGAKHVIGVDASAEACMHASTKYRIETRVGNAEAIPIADGSFDVVTSFETIEHLPHPDRFLDECVRVLKPGGIIIVSTPNRGIYREGISGNPFHISELTEAEFNSLLGQRFRKYRLYTQHPVRAAWWSFRSLASDSCPWSRLRHFGRLRRLLQRAFCPEVLSLNHLDNARADPICWIARKNRPLSGMANPYAIRPLHQYANERATYLIAVATLY
jgi:SAM-dependent methyltransferase